MQQRKRAKAPSMVDVAHEAGVGLVTVSRVLNDPDVVSEETRQRVQQAIDKLGYRRNDLARALKSGRSTTIGVVIAGSEVFELSSILRGVDGAAQAAGYWVSLASWQHGAITRLSELVDRLADQAVEGVAIVADHPLEPAIVERMAARLPVTVVRSGDLDLPSVSSVEIDQRVGARLATQHLLDHGHRRIVHLTGRMDAFDAQARRTGWADTMRDAGLPEPQLEGDFTAASGYRLTQELLTWTERPTGLFVGNDLMAVGVLAALAEAGVDAPGEMSVVGFDDMTGADYLVPALTTVRQDFVRLGRTSIESLVRLIRGQQTQHHLITPTLVVRASSGPVAAGA